MADAADGQISAISSATVTSKAVTNCVNLSVKAAESVSADVDAVSTDGEIEKEDGGAE